MPARNEIEISLAAHLLTRLLMVASRSACLRMASAVLSRSVKGTLFHAIRFAKFLFALDPRRVILPRNNALALRRGGRHPLGDPPPSAYKFCWRGKFIGARFLSLIGNWKVEKVS